MGIEEAFLEESLKKAIGHLRSGELNNEALG